MMQINAFPPQPCELANMRYLLCLLPLILFAGTAAAADPEAGHKLAKRWCVECHDIEGNTTNDRVPGWRQIVNERKRTAEHIRAFLIRPHGEMPPIQLSRREIDDLIAYIETLKAK